MESNSIDDKEAILLSLRAFEIETINEATDISHLENLLANFLNDLIDKDFNKLISVLYRIDISQEKAAAALATKREDEGDGKILAVLIIARQKQKIISRKLYSK